jgi:hypothetical protein
MDAVGSNDDHIRALRGSNVHDELTCITEVAALDGAANPQAFCGELFDDTMNSRLRKP